MGKKKPERSPENCTQNISMPVALKKQVAEMAKRSNRNMSNMIATILMEYIAKDPDALLAEETPAYETGSRTVPIAPAKDGHPKRRASAS
jgi:hypothetical protein